MQSSHLPRVIFIATAALVLALLVLFQVPGLNGSSHWQWEWRRLPPIRWYGLMLLAAAPVFAAVVLARGRTGRTAAAILLLMLASLALKLASAAAVDPPAGLGFIADIVRSREATSYFIDAGALSNYPGWFSAYDQVLPRTGLHTRSKPPGPLLYWTAFIHAFGYTDRAAILGGITLGLLAMFAIPATWWMVRRLTDDPQAALLAAAMLALCPGFELFFPMLDPVYIVLSCGMIGLWHITVVRDSYIVGACFGVMLVIVTMTAYPLLSLGLFLLLHGLLNTRRRLPAAAGITLRQGMAALAVVALVYLVLWFFTSYDPIATFRSAWDNQHRFLAQHEPQRQWPATIPWDLLDLALGAAWLPVILALLLLARSLRGHGETAPHHRGLVILCLAQPIVVAFSGLVQSETARVWAFMLPLLLLPAALELRRWSRREQLIFVACMWLLLAVVGQNMRFLNPG